MAKAKAKGQPGVQNRHIYTRASYLYQAAAYLATAAASSGEPPRSSSSSSSSSRRDDAATEASRPGEAAAAAVVQEETSSPRPTGASEKEVGEDKDIAAAAPAVTYDNNNDNNDPRRKALQNMSRRLVADMRAVSRKVLIRQRPEIKRAVCRYCDALLFFGPSANCCEAVVENASRGGRKPWADVLLLRCRACGGVKRFPVCLSGPRVSRLGEGRKRGGSRMKKSVEKSDAGAKTESFG